MSKQPSVIIIDDDEAPREMLKDFCETLGYNAYAFSDLEETKKFLKDTPEIDLVILDVFIKGKNSLSFIDYLKSNGYIEIPVIIISGAINPDFIQEAITKNVYDFVPKPFTLQQIKERIENALNYCLMTKQHKKYYSHIESLLKERTEKLEQLAIQSVKALANAIEARDPYTRGHSERVAMISTMMGRELGLEEETLAKLELAGLLHDVGKVGIPDRILLKPGRLTPFEYTIMKEHSKMSALIVSEIDPLKGIVSWIKHHHEHYDGNGYPDGLKGTEIPLESQLIAIADNFDAITSIRPYREKITKDEAINYIESQFGKKFNPDIRDIAIKVLKDCEICGEKESKIVPFIEKFRESMIYIDFLTGLFWYPYLKKFINETIAKKQPFFIVFVDILGISKVNRELGRIAGDQLIIKVANALTMYFTHPCIVVRSGGDDFIIYAPIDTKTISENLEKTKRTLSGENIEIHAKILAYPRDGSSYDELISHA
ncbi:MAG: HD domain-containing protein [Proteobacteria bacterium]|nr:HD domain-containing protein [Pseudomonadota bacterium]